MLIRDDERNSVLYFIGFFFLVGCGLAFGKASSEALFFKRYGIEHLPVIYFALGLLLAVISLVYASFADRIAAEKFFLNLFIILAAALVIIWFFISQLRLTSVYPVYLLLYEAASEIILLHSAIYISQNFDFFSSKRLSPIILAGSQLGLIIGGLLVALMAPVIGTDAMIAGWVIISLLTIGLLVSWHLHRGSSAYFFRQNEKLSLDNSLRMLKQGLHFSKTSTLLAASLLVFFFLVITFYILYFVTNQIYTDYFTSEDTLTAFFGILTAVTSILGIIIQVAITNRAIKKYGIPKMNLVFPVAMSLSFILLLFLKFPAALLGSFVKDSLHPALNTPLRNLIMSILPKNIQGRIRAVLIGVVLPAALLCTSAILLLAQAYGQSQYFLLSGLVTSLLMLMLSFKVSRHYLSTLVQHLKEQVFLPEDCLKQQTPDIVLKEFAKHIEAINVNHDDELIVSYAKILLRTYPAQTSKIINQHLASLPAPIAQQLLDLMNPEAAGRQMAEVAGKSIDSLQLDSQLLPLLFNINNSDAVNFIEPLLSSRKTEQVITGIYGAMSLNKHTEKASLLWAEQVRNGQLQSCMPLVKFLDQLPANLKQEITEAYQGFFLQALQSTREDELPALLDSLTKWPDKVDKKIADILLCHQFDSQPAIREKLVHCSHLLPAHDAMMLLIHALDDPHATVCAAAVNQLLSENANSDDIAAQWLTEENFLTVRAQHSLLQHLIDTGLSTKTINKITNYWIEQTRKFYDARQVLKLRQQTTADFLLYTTLTERLQQSLQLLLLLLSTTRQHDLISIIQAAINSHDKLLVASASEAMKCLDNTKISDLIIDILQDDFELKTHYSLHFKDTTEAINWSGQQDDWLHTCAGQVLAHA